MAEKGDSGGTKSVLLFLAFIAIIAVTCFVPLNGKKPLLHSCLPDGPVGGPSKTKKKLILDKPAPPLEDVTSGEQRDLDRLIRKSKTKKKKR